MLSDKVLKTRKCAVILGLGAHSVIMILFSFLQTRTDFRLLDLGAAPPPALTGLIDRRGMLRTLPFAHDLDAFFGAVLMRASAA